MSPTTKPRDFALRELDAKRLPHWPPNALKKHKPTAPPADPRDVALAEHITLGVVTNLLLLQHLIQHYSGRNLKSIDLVVQKVLAIGLYQLGFLDRIPASAAVDEAVEQSRRFGQSRASGFVNAVLRKATRDSAPTLPPRENAAQHAHLVLSHPPELFQKLEQLLGKEDALRFCEHDQIEPPTIVRASIEKLTASEGITLTPHEHPGMYVVSGAKRSHLAEFANKGLAQVQDPTAAAVASQLALQPGQTVLDRCAGLGTKTLQLRDAVGETGRVVAMDPAEQRCEALRHLLAQRQIENVDVHAAAWLNDLTDIIPAQFDRILADVPCSNSGVLARRPEARYAQTPAALQSLAKLQDRILADSAPFLRPGGLLAYSTCSVWPEENRHRIDAFLKQHPDFELLHDLSTLPSFDPDPTRYHDGGYVAVLRRK
ncbi:MAG: rsmB [Phycisphaerales bacterium]|nr:rsmB [Phycisphaerales bacterium]